MVFQRVCRAAIRAITAMTNSISGECTVIVGVAEKEDDAKDHEKKFGKNYIKYSSKFVVGIDCEAQYIKGGIDPYLKSIKDYVQASKNISDLFKSKILNKISMFTYKEKEILIFRAERGATPEAYHGEYFERHLSHNNKVEAGPEMAELFKRFV